MRLSQDELLDAVKRYLYRRGDIPAHAVGYFRHKFGLVGEPQITLMGDATELPDAGHVYLEWSFEELPNVATLPEKRNGPG